MRLFNQSCQPHADHKSAGRVSRRGQVQSRMYSLRNKITFFAYNTEFFNNFSGKVTSALS